MRVNARLEPGLAKKVAYLKAKRGTTTTGVLKLAIDAYYEQESRGGASALERLEQTGFVGCAEGPKDLSVRYKQELTKSLTRKLRGHRR